MKNEQLLEEIRLLREETKQEFNSLRMKIDELEKEFYIFKGKAFGFITILSTVIGYAIDLLRHKG